MSTESSGLSTPSATTFPLPDTDTLSRVTTVTIYLTPRVGATLDFDDSSRRPLRPAVPRSGRMLSTLHAGPSRDCDQHCGRPTPHPGAKVSDCQRRMRCWLGASCTASSNGPASRKRPKGPGGRRVESEQLHQRARQESNRLRRLNVRVPDQQQPIAGLPAVDLPAVAEE